ncbi:hypothetical protein ABPG74_018587 [Tetrahymena malaccensis]
MEDSNQSQNTQNTILNIKILELSKQILSNLSQQLKEKQFNSIIKICFEESFQEVEQELIIDFTDVLKTYIQIEKLNIINIKNDYSNNYILDFLKQMDQQQVQEFKLKLFKTQISQQQSDQLNKTICNFQNLKTIKIILSKVIDPQPFLYVIQHQLKSLQTLKIEFRDTQLEIQETQLLVNSIIQQNQLKKLELELILQSLNESNLQKIPFYLNKLEYFSLIFENKNQIQAQQKNQIIKNHIEENFQRQIEYLIIEENTKINENTDTSYLLGLDILNCYSNITSLSTDLTQYSEQNLFNYILQVSKFDQLRQLNLKLNTSQIKNNIVCYYKQQFENLKELNELSLVVKSHDYYEDEYLFPSLVRYTTQISKLRLQLKTIKLTDALYKQLFEVLPSLKHLKQIYFNFGQGYLIKFNHQIFGSNLKKCKNLNSVTLDFENIISPKKTLKDQTQIILQNESLNSDKDTKDTKTNLRTQLTSIAIAKSLIENHIKKKLQQTLYQNNAYKKASRLVKVEIK